jgi:hypothetical protein
MKKNLTKFTLFLSLALALFACSKKEETIVTEIIWLTTKGHGILPMRTLSRFLASEIEKLSVVGLLMGARIVE